jgi:hypothetical protein
VMKAFAGDERRGRPGAIHVKRRTCKTAARSTWGMLRAHNA